MHWHQLIKSRSHVRVLDYLADPEHQELGPPSIDLIAAALQTDHKSAANLVKPLLDAGMVKAMPGPFHAAVYELAEVMGEVS